MPPQTHLIVGASRGIGLEFVTQLLARGDTVIATARPISSTYSTLSSLLPISEAVSASLSASKLVPLLEGPYGKNLTVLECNVTDEESIKGLAVEVGKLGGKGGVLEKSGGVIDTVVINAGVLVYPGRIGEISFSSFEHQMRTNTVGPLLTAQQLLALSAAASPIHINTLVFISSDSGSLTNFRAFEDGLGAYAVSKAALNMGMRHLAAELSRSSKSKAPVVLAIHPGEVSTDMASDVTLDWDVEGVISAEESIRCMLKTIGEKGWEGVDEGGVASAQEEGRSVEFEKGEASFWTWEGRRYPW